MEYQRDTSCLHITSIVHSAFTTCISHMLYDRVWGYGLLWCPDIQCVKYCTTVDYKEQRL